MDVSTLAEEASQIVTDRELRSQQKPYSQVSSDGK
jgi:hypothetical protein